MLRALRAVHFNLLEADNPSFNTKWLEEYGSTMRTDGILGVSTRLVCKMLFKIPLIGQLRSFRSFSCTQ